MQLGVRYETTYRYDAPVHFSTHKIRLFTRGDVHTQILRVKFETNDGASVRFGRDVFDNCVASCTFSDSAKELCFHLELDLALRKRNPFDFLLVGEATSLPFSYSPELERALAPFRNINPDPLLEIPCWTQPRPDAPRPTVAAAVREIRVSTSSLFPHPNGDCHFS